MEAIALIALFAAILFCLGLCLARQSAIMKEMATLRGAVRGTGVVLADVARTQDPTRTDVDAQTLAALLSNPEFAEVLKAGGE